MVRLVCWENQKTQYITFIIPLLCCCYSHLFFIIRPTVFKSRSLQFSKSHSKVDLWIVTNKRGCHRYISHYLVTSLRMKYDISTPHILLPGNTRSSLTHPLSHSHCFLYLFVFKQSTKSIRCYPHAHRYGLFLGS